jgi:hypothetical protein
MSGDQVDRVFVYDGRAQGWTIASETLQLQRLRTGWLRENATTGSSRARVQPVVAVFGIGQIIGISK